MGAPAVPIGVGLGEILIGGGLAVGGTIVVSEAIDGDDAANLADSASGATTTTCATCGDPQCDKYNKKIDELVDELKFRRQDALRDIHNLYGQRLEYFIGRPLYIDGRNVGSWEGHISQWDQRQRELNKNIDKAERRGCKINNKDANKWANKKFPRRPLAARPRTGRPRRR